MARRRLGITSGDNFPLQRPSVGVAAGYAVKANLQILRLTGKALGQFFTGQRSARNTLSGPVGIYKAASSSVERFGWGGFFTTLAFLSLNLGIFNLLPIPVLDGGAIFLLLIESLLATVGLSLSLRVRERIQQVGFVMVILLMVFVITNDLVKAGIVVAGRRRKSTGSVNYRRNSVMRKTRAVQIKNVQIGGGAPVVIQSMTKTDTADVGATVAQIEEMMKAGCEVVRLAVPDNDAAIALKEIRKRVPDVPLVADIHFHYKLALMALDAGIDKLRLNPGNIGKHERVREVVRAAQAQQGSDSHRCQRWLARERSVEEVWDSDTRGDG